MQMPTLARVIAVSVFLAACSTSEPSAAPASGAPGTIGPASSGLAPGATQSPGAPSVPTSGRLIQTALDAGRIDAATALRYRIYAVFGAQELPAEFRSTDWVEDDAALDLATLQLDGMSAPDAEAIRPFLVRPTDPSSVFRASPPAAAVRLASLRDAQLTATVTCGADGWASIEGVSHFKVWGRCGAGYDDADLELLAGILDALWTEESTYMGRQPRGDAGGVDEGGDDRVDFYLVGNCVTRAGDCQTHTGLAATTAAGPYVGSTGSRKSSAYVVINRATVGSPYFPSNIGHELFHVLQNAFNLEGKYSTGTSHWFVEASASWAEFKFVGAPTYDPARFAAYQSTTYPLQDKADDNAYDSFVWPLFMDEEAGDGTVANAWAALEGVATWDGFTDAIDAQLPFKQHFRDFAVRDWNDDALAAVIGPMLPIGATGDPRLLPGGPRRGADETLLANGGGAPPSVFAVGLQSLSAWFEHLTVDSAVGQVTLDFSDLQPRASLDIDLLVNVPGLGWDRRQVVGDKIQFCRNVPADEVTEIVVVLSNHDKDPFSNTHGLWTAESLKDPCPVGMTGDLTAELVDMYIDPDGVQHPITGTLRVHLVIEIGPYGSLYVARGSTYSYEMRYAPLFACGSGVVMDSGGLAPRVGQGPYDNADPNARGTATIGGGGEGPGAELGLDISIPPPANACQGGWIQTFGFVRDELGTYVHDVPRTRFDKFNGYREDESHGTIVGGP